MASSVSSNSFSRWASHDIFLFKYQFLLKILRFLFLFSHKIMAHVASKRQSCSYPPDSHVQKDTQNWQKIDKSEGKIVLCQRTFSSVFHAVFYTVKLHSLMGPLWLVYLKLQVIKRRILEQLRITNWKEWGRTRSDLNCLFIIMPFAFKRWPIYLQRKIVLRSRNRLCSGKATMHSVCIAAVHVTVSCIKILSVAQQCSCGLFMSPATMKRT
jgi:hypothetical protein